MDEILHDEIFVLRTRNDKRALNVKCYKRDLAKNPSVKNLNRR